VCEECHARLAGWDECLRAMRPALRKLTASVPSVGAWRSRSPDTTSSRPRSAPVMPFSGAGVPSDSLIPEWQSETGRSGFQGCLAEAV
jgi:hypothetical protein